MICICHRYKYRTMGHGNKLVLGVRGKVDVEQQLFGRELPSDPNNASRAWLVGTVQNCGE